MNPAAQDEGTFADALNAVIGRSGKSFRSVARAIGIGESHFAKMRRGKVRHPHPRTIHLLAQELDAPELLDFIGRNSEDELRSIREEMRSIREALSRLEQVVAQLARGGSGSTGESPGPPPPG